MRNKQVAYIWPSVSLGKRAVEIVKHITGSYKLQLLKRQLSEHAKHASSDADGFTIKPVPKLTAGLEFFWSPFFGQAKKGEIVMLVKQKVESRNLGKAKS